jgi:hypothetical protein
MPKRESAILVAAVAMLTVGVRAAETASSDPHGAQRVVDAVQAASSVRMRGTDASHVIIAQAGGNADGRTQPEKKPETPLQKRSRELREEIARTIAEEEGKKLPESVAEIKKLLSEKRGGEMRALSPSLQKEIEDEARRIAAENAEKNASAERAERALVTPTSPTVTVEEDTEASKERAYREYEREQAVEAGRELREDLRDLRNLLDTAR